MSASSFSTYAGGLAAAAAAGFCFGAAADTRRTMGAEAAAGAAGAGVAAAFAPTPRRAP